MPISPHSQSSQHQQPSLPPLIDFDSPSSSFVSMSSSSATAQSLHSTRPKSHSPPSRAPIRARQHHPSSPRHHLDESNIDRFAMLFAPATPPATPTQTVDSNEKSLSKRLSQLFSRPAQHRRTHTESSTDSDFGPFVSVPPHQDPLTPSPDMTLPAAESSSVVDFAETSQIGSTGKARNASLDYFGQFTTTAKVASERNRKGVLDELLDHQDDPLYFLAAQVDDPPPSHQSMTLALLPEEEPELQGNATSISQEHTPGHAPVLSPHESIADALASDLDMSSKPHPFTHSPPHAVHTHPHNRSPVLTPTHKRSLSSLAGLPRTGTALPPRLSGNASPPSVSSPNASGVSLPLALGLDKAQGSGSEERKVKEREINRERQSTSPSQATLSRISSNLVSAFLSGTSKHGRSNTTSPSSSTTGTLSSSFPAHPSSFSEHSSFTSITHRGSPFVSTPFVPPSGAPGFTGDRNWDKGFFEALQRDKESGAVDITGLGGELERANGDSSYEAGSDLLSGSRKDEFSASGGSALRRSGTMEGRLKSTKGKVKAKGLSLCGRREGTLQVLTEDVANSLRIHLPALIRLSRNWTLLYSIDQHGISLNTLYSHCEPRIPSKAEPNPPTGALLVVKDSLDGMFGAWIGEGIMKGQNGFYGSGEAFLWQYRTDAAPPLEVYKWSGKNDYVILCDPDFISFGGGDGHYGLYIDSSLLEGSSAPCPTFDNPVLCARPPSHTGKKDVSFECVGLEVWGIGPG